MNLGRHRAVQLGNAVRMSIGDGAHVALS